MSFGSGGSSFQSTPGNYQNPALYGLGPGVAQGISTLFGMGPNGFNGSTGNGTFSPFMVNGVQSNSSQNPLAAQLTPQQNSSLASIFAMSQPGAYGGVTPGSSASDLSSFRGNYAQPAANNMPAAASLVQSFLDPNFASNLATSSQTKSAISSATNPIEQAFRTSTVPGITGASTQAGQRTQAGGQAGSSAFDTAFGQAQGNLMATEAQTAGSIANAAYQAGININANAPSMASGLASAAEGQTMQAENQPVNIGTTELNNMIQSLQSEVLPQLTQQYGINQGLSLFNTQIQTILQALGYGTQAAQPALAERSSGSGSNFNFGAPSGFKFPGFG